MSEFSNPVAKAIEMADIGFTGAKVTVNPVVKARGVDDAIFTSVLYAKFGFPYCCISKGDESLHVNPANVYVTRHEEVCKMTAGGGYTSIMVPLTKVNSWSTFASKFICGKEKYGVNVAHTTVMLGPEASGADFMSKMRKQVATVRGLGGNFSDHTKDFATLLNCGKTTITLKVGQAGDLQLVEEEKGCTTKTQTRVVFAHDMKYIYAQRATPLGAILCGHNNSITVAIGDEDLELPTKNETVPEATTAILSAIAGRDTTKDVPIAQYTSSAATLCGGEKAVNGGAKMTIVPGFVRIENAPKDCLSCGLCDPISETIVRAGHVSYIRAGLPSLQSAFIKAVRDMKCLVIGKKIAQVYGGDAAKLISVIILAIKALITAISFIILVITRRTTVIIGGTGAADTEILFPPAVPDPEPLMTKLGKEIASAMQGSAHTPSAADLEKGKGATIKVIEESPAGPLGSGTAKVV